ncbi:MAG: pilus (MSHA type) biogenesis protein MshL [Thiotrichales bacterium]|nr:pilus (MSHA type) biogenesis protein MshL [Thiotrichales bacterium]MBT4971856.1 pilus (MSHA type) biogenesis protein MshL [Thiotrichales bacterium]MBT5418352.1 pilus (MSHA type) biogenesis protein MshL [Thiotrichales bacterium]MBT6172834.1 pilus (MSHA type) biogenesis protein MshL [Thiotrichales bacterium]MBT7314828.1 pilus (MSHA type) biogenesis protein MshL [Thiotrichales bacterium]
MKYIGLPTLVLLSLFLLQGCETTASKRDRSLIQEMDVALQVAELPANSGIENSVIEEIPMDVGNELLPSLLVTIPTESSPINLEPKFNISVRDIEAEEFFFGIFEGTPYSIVLAPGVEGKISLSLQETSIQEVLEVVASVYGYAHRSIPGGYMILPSSIRTQIFQIDYLNINRDGASKTMISLGHLTTTDIDGEGGGLSGSNVETTSNSDFWVELQSTLSAIIGSDAGRKVVISSQTGVITVHAMPAELRIVEQFIERLQGNLSRQVLLEAKILEVELSDGYQSGINWSTLFEPGSNKSVVMGKTGGSGGIFDSATGVVSSNSPGTGKFSQVELDTGSFGGVLGVALNLNDFTAMIELLETQGAVRVLSSPRISTINNQKAVIKVGIDKFFVTDVGTVTTTGTATSTAETVDINPFFSGISLDVTPQINRDGQVILHVHPTVVEVTDDSKVLPTSTTAVPLAKSSVRESDSVIIANNRQVVVIGGLMKSIQREDDASVPVLGDVPFFGKAFKHERTSMKKLELVILIRPTVIESPKQWRADLEQTQNRFQQLNMDSE